MDKQKIRTAEEWLDKALEHLEDVTFSMACFVDHFKKSVEMMKDDRT